MKDPSYKDDVPAELYMYFVKYVNVNNFTKCFIKYKRKDIVKHSRTQSLHALNKI